MNIIKYDKEWYQRVRRLIQYRLWVIVHTKNLPRVNTTKRIYSLFTKGKEQNKKWFSKYLKDMLQKWNRIIINLNLKTKS